MYNIVGTQQMGINFTVQRFQSKRETLVNGPNKSTYKIMILIYQYNNVGMLFAL